MERIHPIWKSIQHEIRHIRPPEFANHPLIRRWMLSTTWPSVTDFLAFARSLDPRLFSRLIKRLDDNCLKLLPRSSDPRISDKTASQLYYLMRLRAFGSELRRMRIIEIGGGIGNLARLAISLGLCKSYALVDISGVVDIQSYFLRDTLEKQMLLNLKILNVENATDRELLCSMRADLVVSTFGVSETPRGMQDWYLKHVVGPSRLVYLVGQRNFRGRRVDRRLLEVVAHTHDVVEADFIYTTTADWKTFEIFGVRKPPG